MKKKYNINNLGFIHLRLHSAYSLLEGSIQIDSIIENAVKDYQPAIAIADTNNLFGALEFSQKCLMQGIQPIIGCQILINFQDNDDLIQDKSIINKNNSFASIVLFAKTKIGYNNLIQLISSAYLDKDNFINIPYININFLKNFSSDLIALSGGNNGPINNLLLDNKYKKLNNRLDILQNIFKNNFYIELQRYENYNVNIERELIYISYKKSLPIVATNEVFFLCKNDYKDHDALLAIAENKIITDENRRRATNDNYFKKRIEMMELFKDIPESLENTIEIARRCHICPFPKKPMLPSFFKYKIKENAVDISKIESSEMIKKAYIGLNLILKNKVLSSKHSINDYKKRLKYEISIIVNMNFAGYFLIVSDFVKWAKSKDIPVGPGRGSGAGSLVAYALNITEIDPLRFSLLFERFLNPNRISIPDFDIDFCQERREEVIKYLKVKYGQDKVAHIITFGTLQARAVLRDVGRVLQMPYRQVDRISKLVPSHPGYNISLSKAILKESKFKEEIKNDKIVSKLLEISIKLEGLYRHTSIHAAGIVISDKPLREIVPMYYDPRSKTQVTQFSMQYVEKAGLVKFDILGLKTLTIINKIKNSLKKKNINIDISNINLDDNKTYKMLSDGNTVGVFQLESIGISQSLIEMQPEKIEDIIALISLYRPGPIDNISTYNNRKNNKQKIISIHPIVDNITEETYGVIIYQEQVMQIAQRLSGYSLGEADILRRSIGKKNRIEMRKQRKIFIEGALKNQVSKSNANEIFNLLEKFADYGFNKSHAAAYAIISYQTAYLKANYPLEFFASSMSYDMSNIEKINKYRRNAEFMNIEIVPPSVQTSYNFFISDNMKIYYSLSAIKGVGESASTHIVSVRNNKKFKNIADFCKKTDPNIINRRVWESLIDSGSFDCFKISRHILIENLDMIISKSRHLSSDAKSGQIDIFDSCENELIFCKSKNIFNIFEQLNRELKVIGFYLSSHPLDQYKNILYKYKIKNWNLFSIDIEKKLISNGYLAGTVISKKIYNTKIGNKIGIFNFSDTSGEYEAIVFSKDLYKFYDLFEIGKSFIINVNIERKLKKFILKIKFANMLNIEDNFKSMNIYLDKSDVIENISRFLNADENGLVVNIIFFHKIKRKKIKISLNSKFKIGLKIVENIKSIAGVKKVELL